MSKAPTRSPPPDFAVTEAVLRLAVAPIDAAEAHGNLCGMLCALGPDGADEWLEVTLADAQSAEHSPGREQAEAALHRLAAHTARELEDAEPDFRLLLPGDDDPLADRAEALGLWCTGFSRGLLDGAERLRASTDHGDLPEILADFAELGAMGHAGNEDEPDAEDAWIELVEFVRVSTQLVYEECATMRPSIDAR
jgi:hypothetical protein